MFSNLLNKEVIFKERVYTKGPGNTLTSSIGTSSYNSSGEISVKGYLTVLNPSQINLGKNMVNYFYRLFIDYNNNIVSRENDYVVFIEDKYFELVDIVEAYNSSHLEITLNKIENI